jgi:1,4-alpha-glucan branching enzyme
MLMRIVRMNRILFTLLLMMTSVLFNKTEVYAQNVPTITPTFFTPNTTITVTYDVTGSQLSALTNAYIWVWIPGAGIDAKYNINPASSNTALTNNAKFNKSVVNGRTLFSITFKPADFFTANINTQTKMGMLLKGNNFSGTIGTDGQTSDYIADFWDGTYQLKVFSPTSQAVFVNNGQSISIKADAPENSTFKTFVNGNQVDVANNTTSYTYSHTVNQVSGAGEIIIEASNGVTTKEFEFEYILRGPSPIAARPAGIKPGINYSANTTKATLCLWAPLKNTVYVRGDFNDWQISSTYQLAKDGEYFWIELNNLTPGVEYGFQYIVDETIIVADPYADKILDPDDRFIPAATYPNLKQYPQKALSSVWYQNRVSVLQTNQTPYTWQVTNFQRPSKEKLVVYELLIRDFFENGKRNYQNLIDSIQYFKRIGINAIQLMPVMEFNGNEGWGYNPTFMFAPDKYYGTKNKLKEFVDVCHQNGIAVILDIAMNHQDVPNTYAAMYFDFGAFKPTSDNPWFNVNARHPFNVFFDMNHESNYTKKYLDTVNYYWLNEYKIDGYRFDLSKGFTQVNSGSDVGFWSAYDPSRIALLKRMADKIWSNFPTAYVILEHLGVNSEEKEMAEYRANEGKGMMFWGKMTEPYNQNTMGYESNASFSSVLHTVRGWTTPGLVGYMESHDEERLMYKNIQFGRVTDDYNVKELNTALKRMEPAFAMFLTLPGPKMIWQFGEVGFDYSINRCEDGTVKEDCRLAPKPVPTNYYANQDRLLLLDKFQRLMKLRNTYDVFSGGEAAFQNAASLMKAVVIKNTPYNSNPTNVADMNAVVIANFDVTAKSLDVVFPHAGSWYDFTNDGFEINLPSETRTITLQPGQYQIYTDVSIPDAIVTSVEEEITQAKSIEVYPNPSKGEFVISGLNEINQLEIINLAGQKIPYERTNHNAVRIEAAPGLYLIKGFNGKNRVLTKIIIE